MWFYRHIEMLWILMYHSYFLIKIMWSHKLVLHHYFIKQKFHALGCVETSISNIELKPISRDCHDKKITVYSCFVRDKPNSNLIQYLVILKQKTTICMCSIWDKSFSRNHYLKQHMLTDIWVEKSALNECSSSGKIFKCNPHICILWWWLIVKENCLLVKCV